MAEKRYDVIIVGAGISGLKLAELLNDSKLNVLLVEKRPTIKKLVNHIYGVIPWEYIEKWDLHKYLIRKQGFGFGYYGTEIRHYRKKPTKPLGIVDMNSWAKSLRLNCNIKTSLEIVNLKRESDGITLIDKKKNKYFGNIIIDCSGDNQTISSLLGIKRSSCDFWDYACVFENANITKLDESFYFLDLNLINSGGWYYPLSKDKCLIGIAEWTGDNYLSSKELIKRMDAFRKNFYPLNIYTKNAKIVESIQKIGPTSTLHSSIAEDNYIAVGDASGGGTPLIGLGFYVGFEMASLAHKNILFAFKKDDFSKKTLSSYLMEFHNNFSRWYLYSRFLRYIVLQYMTDEEMNTMIRNLDIYDDAEYYNIIKSEITFQMIAKLLLKNWFWIKILKNAFRVEVLKPIGFKDIERRPLVLKKKY